MQTQFGVDWKLQKVKGVTGANLKPRKECGVSKVAGAGVRNPNNKRSSWCKPQAQKIGARRFGTPNPKRSRAKPKPQTQNVASFNISSKKEIVCVN